MSSASRAALLGLIIATAAVLVACSSAGPGDSGRPVPAWSPPTWLHGTWKTADSELASATLKASRYNVEIDIRVSGLTSTVDVAEIAEDGIATITHEAGVSSSLGVRYYYLKVIYGNGASQDFLMAEETSTTIIGSMTTIDVNGSRTDSGAIFLTKQT